MIGLNCEAVVHSSLGIRMVFPVNNDSGARDGLLINFSILILRCLWRDEI